MRRIGLVPMGLTYFFLTASRMEASPNDFASVAEYETYRRQRATHPISSMRILAIAEAVQSQTDAFARLQDNQVSSKKKLQEMVRQLRTIATTLNDPQMLAFLAMRGQSVDISAFQRACRR